MEKLNIRKMMVVICIFLVAIMVGGKCYAYTPMGSGEVTKSVAKDGKVKKTVTKHLKNHTDRLEDIANRKIGVRGTGGIYCMLRELHVGYEANASHNVTKTEVGKYANDIRFVLALENKKDQFKGPDPFKWKNGLVQNFIWWMLGPGKNKGLNGKHMGTYDAKSYFGIPLASAPFISKYDYNTIADANNDYNEYSKTCLEGDRYKKSKGNGKR